MGERKVDGMRNPVFEMFFWGVSAEYWFKAFWIRFLFIYLVPCYHFLSWVYSIYYVYLIIFLYSIWFPPCNPLISTTATSSNIWRFYSWWKQSSASSWKYLRLILFTCSRKVAVCLVSVNYRLFINLHVVCDVLWR